MVDYNQSLDPAEACRRIAAAREFDLAWVEEPGRLPRTWRGTRKVRACGGYRYRPAENWWFPRDMQKGHRCRGLRPRDAGPGEDRRRDRLAGRHGQGEAASIPVSSHIYVEASAHVLPVTPTAHWLEFSTSRAGILEEPMPGGRGCGSGQGTRAGARLGRGGRRTPRPLEDGRSLTGGVSGMTSSTEPRPVAAGRLTGKVALIFGAGCGRNGQRQCHGRHLFPRGCGSQRDRSRCGCGRGDPPPDRGRGRRVSRHLPPTPPGRTTWRGSSRWSSSAGANGRPAQ